MTALMAALLRAWKLLHRGYRAGEASASCSAEASAGLFLVLVLGFIYGVVLFTVCRCGGLQANRASYRLERDQTSW
jgi:hypothetical protein